MKILTAPNPVLFKKAESVKKIDQKITQLIESMTETLRQSDNPKGVGLAAPQVGVSLKVFIVRENQKSTLYVFINPKVTKRSKKLLIDKKMFEGCLSVKDVWAPVNRFSWVEIKYQNQQGLAKKERFSGMMATIIQHEMDHLNGILFTQRALKQGQKLYQREIGKDGKPVFKQIQIA